MIFVSAVFRKMESLVRDFGEIRLGITEYIYVVDLGNNVLKIGRTKDVARRMKEYKTHHANGVPLLMVFQTHNG